ncbi:hypothetical protein AB0P17_27275 [Streptomyces sp. NPDC088124]
MRAEQFAGDSGGRQVPESVRLVALLALFGVTNCDELAAKIDPDSISRES